MKLDALLPHVLYGIESAWLSLHDLHMGVREVADFVDLSLKLQTTPAILPALRLFASIASNWG